MSKIIDLKNINNFRKKNKNKKIVLCHGVFDILHYGHLQHFKSAKKFGDILVVSITKSKFINKGPGRPVFSDFQRLDYLQSLQIVDYVCLSEEASSIDVIKTIRPTFYVKGQDYKKNADDKTKKIILEKNILKKYGGAIKYTNEITFSSSKLINNGNFLLNDEQKKFIEKIKKKHSYQSIEYNLKKLNLINVIVIGEVIIDKYTYGDVIGKSGKEPHLVFSKSFSENYIGGSGAVARHLASFVRKVNLFSPFGFEKNYINLFKRLEYKNIFLNFFKPFANFQTISKERFIDSISKYKMFGSYILTRLDKSEKIYQTFLKEKMQKIIKKNDLILVCDYGHNFINSSILNQISNSKKFVSMNTQKNSYNNNDHNIQKFSKLNCIIINEGELRSEMKDNTSTIKKLIKFYSINKKITNIIITRGASGAILYNYKKNSFYECPAFAVKSIDKVGAGDAFLAMASLALAQNYDPELSLFLGSLASASSVETIGNKNSINYDYINRSVEFLLK